MTQKRFQTARGIVGVYKGRAEGPEQLVEHERRTGDGDLAHQLCRNMHTLVRVLDKPESGMPTVRDPHDVAHLQKPCDHGRKCRTGNAHCGTAELAVDEDIVEDQIREDGDHGGDHRRDGLPHFTQQSGIDLNHHKRHKSPQRNFQIRHAVLHGQCDVGGIVRFTFHKEHGKRISPEPQDHDGDHGHHAAEKQPESERIAHTLPVARSEKLRAEDGGTGQSAEDGQIVNKDQLVHDRHAAHRYGAESADHEIVEQGYKIGNALLDDKRDSQSDQCRIERLIPDILFAKIHGFLPLDSVLSGIWHPFYFSAIWKPKKFFVLL